ncbi:parallel beta-helix repeat (two copies) [Sporobacter termitidis DSM 10068]|uniref:Parallel beta-helix repeat (Two copies) n=1 Tax=Sporobacter termitidis DSM 10068 TaxID=1123282 RepID=A0A1M5YKM0_9FIRM|nr:S-layer homology domain-containing protein [Sporobacter termitidis]SHI12566.1 parallel beta-helix repeat (two copies) [Sporobacter termitidis DSM 10068]
MKRKILCIILSLVFVLSLLPATGLAAYTDTQNSWAQAAIEKWSGLGIIQGSDGKFRPDDPITRGEMAVIVDRLMKFQTKAQNNFTDLKQDYYTDAVLKANAVGIITGYGGLIRPLDNITREESAVMLGRAFGLSESTAASSFTDGASISSWAQGYVNAMAARGFIQGNQGAFDPKSPITRAGVITILDNAIKGYYTEAKEYTGSVSGVAIVNTPGVVLKDMTITGDLIIAEGVGSGDVTLTNVNVTGNTIVRGGGANSIHIQGTSQIKNLILEKTDDGQIRVVTESGATVDAVYIDDGNDDIILTGSFSSVTIAAGVSVKAVGASITTLNVTGANAALDLDKASAVTTLTANAALSINNNGTITNAVINSDSVSLTGNMPQKVSGDHAVLGTKDVDNTPSGGGGPVTTASVSTLTGFKAALENPSITTINITAEFSTAEKILISRPVTINGGNNAITFTGDAIEWQGNYVLQVYNTTGVTLRNIKLTGGDAALLVNGSAVTLAGTVDVSGNEFGGIEVSKGAGLANDSSLTVTGVTFTNTTEEYGQPTIWLVNDQGTVTGADALTQNTTVKADQTQYYLVEANATNPASANVSTLEEFQTALENPSITAISITAGFSTAEKILISRPVTINGGNNAITFTGDEAGWKGNYVLHVYDTTGVTLRNIKLTGGDAALLVNGSEVTLTGTVDVSGNAFGGIEVSKGTDTGLANSTLTVSGTLVNATEAYARPTLWVINGQGSVTGANVPTETNTTIKSDQTQYYLTAANAAETITLTPDSDSASVAQGAALPEAVVTMTSNYDASGLTTVISLLKDGQPVNFNTLFSSYKLGTAVGDEQPSGPYEITGAYNSYTYGPTGGYSVTAGVPQVTTANGTVNPFAPAGIYTVTVQVKSGDTVLATNTYTLTVTTNLQDYLSTHSYGSTAALEPWAPDRTAPGGWDETAPGYVTITTSEQQNSNSWYDWQGKGAYTGVGLTDNWKVETTLALTPELLDGSGVRTSLWIKVDDANGIATTRTRDNSVDWAILEFRNDPASDGYKGWEWWDSTGNGAWKPLANVPAVEGIYTLTTIYDTGTIYQYINGALVNHYAIQNIDTSLGAVTAPTYTIIQSRTFGASYSALWQVPDISYVSSYPADAIYIASADQLSDAIAHQANDQTWYLKSGTYTVTQQLDIHSSVNITGIGDVTIKAGGTTWSSSNDTKHLLNITGGANPVIANITFDSSKIAYGIQAYMSGATLSNVTLSSSLGAGLTVNGSTVAATNLRTNGNLWGAVNVDPGKNVSTASAFTIDSASVLSDPIQIWSDGLNVNDNATVDVDFPGSYTTFEASGVNYWSTHGPVTLNDSGAFPTINLAIAAATADDTINAPAGTYYESVIVSNSINLVGAGASTTTIVGTDGNATPLTFSGNDAEVSGFTITHNYTAAELTAWSFNNNGVIFSQGKTGNTLTNCIVTLNRNGIYLNNTKGNTITGNTITNNRTGINMTNTVDNTKITGNTISDNWTLGLVYYDQASSNPTLKTDFNTITVSGNTFSNNWYTEIEVKDATISTGTLNVTDNEFPDQTVTLTTADASVTSLNEPGFAAQKPASLGGTGDYASKPSADLPTLRIYNSAGVTLRYDGAVLTVGTAPADFATIQAALDTASDGDTINVAAGTYSLSSQLQITKPISIIGLGNATISPANDFTYSQGNNFTKNLISINGVRDSLVKLENLTVSGSLRSGINVVDSNNVVLSYVTSINNIGAGLIVNSSTVTADHFTASGNSIGSTDWGSVNVDVGSSKSYSSVFNITDSLLQDTMQIWSDGDNITPELTITVPGYSVSHPDTTNPQKIVWIPIT